MEYISLNRPIIKTNDELKALVGDTITPSGIVPVLDKETGVVTGMPEPKDGVIYLVNFGIFNALKETRRDIAMFDDSKAIRGNDGRVVSHGGLIYSK